MGKTWKIVLGLALALPMLAYVAGSLVAAGDEPRDRAPIEFVENPSPSDSSSTGTDPKTKPKKKPQSTKTPKTEKPGGTEVIRPQPQDLDDDDWDDDDDGDDDDSGDDDD